MDPPLQDELRQAIVELTTRLGHLEARYDEENAHNGRNNNRHGPHPRQDHRDNEDNSAKHIKVEALPSMVLGTLRFTMIGCERWSIFLSGMTCLRIERLGLPK